MTLLEKIAKDNDAWYAMALQINGDKYRSQELLQEFYLLLDKEDKRGKIKSINIGYFYIIMKNLNLYLYHVKRPHVNKYKNVECLDFLDEETLIDNITNEREINEEFYNIIEDYMKPNFDIKHFYKFQLLKLNILEGRSIRKLSKDLDISTNKIYNTIKNAKKELKNVLEEDYKTYKNKLNDE